MLDLKNVNATIATIRAENEKGVSAKFAVYRSPNMREGRLTLAVFGGQGGRPVFEATFSRAWIAQTRAQWSEILDDKNETKKITSVVTKSARDQSGSFKSSKVGTLTYGLDQGGKPYIGVATADAAYKFPLYLDLNYAPSEDLPAHLNNRAAVDAFFAILDSGVALIDQTLLVPGEQDGGNRGGGGGGWKGGNRQGGGGGGGSWGGNRGNSQGGGGSGGGANLDDEIAF